MTIGNYDGLFSWRHVAIVFACHLAFTCCSSVSRPPGAVDIEAMQDLKLKTGNEPVKELKTGSTAVISEPTVLSSEGFIPMTIVPTDAGRSKLQIKLIQKEASETGDPQTNANQLIGDVFRIQKLISKGKGSEAVTLIEESQKIWPRVSYLDYLKASALVVSKDYERAITVIDQALTKDPDAKELKELKAQLSRR